METPEVTLIIGEAAKELGVSVITLRMFSNATRIQDRVKNQ